MIIDLIDKLIDRCLQLVKQKKEDRRALFKDFVEPAYAAFETVHNDYLETFREYRRILAEASVPLTSSHPIFDRLRADSLFSQSKRAKLHMLEPLQADPEMGAFIAAISRYLTLSNTTLNGFYASVAPPVVYPPLINRIRTRLRDDLFSRIARGGLVAPRVPSTVAVGALDGVLESIQSHYSQVTGEYDNLKTVLLQKRTRKPSTSKLHS